MTKYKIKLSWWRSVVIYSDKIYVDADHVLTLADIDDMIILRFKKWKSIKTV